MFEDILSTTQSAIQVLAKDKRRFGWMLVLCVVGSGAELVGVGTLFPFLSVLTRPELIEQNYWLHSLYQFLDFSSIRDFMILIGCVALVFFTLANLVTFLKNAYITKYCVSQSARIAKRMLENYLDKPLAFHINSNSGTLSKDVISQSDQFAHNVLLSVMALFSDGAVLIVLVALILSVNFKVGFAVIVFLGVTVGVMLSSMREKITHLGMASDSANSARFTFVIGALQAIREIKTSGRESFFVSRFSRFAESMASYYTKLSIFQLLPSFLTQFFAIAAIIGVALYSLIVGIELTKVMPALVMYAVVGYRLMPSLNKLATAVTTLRQYQVVVQNVSEVLSVLPEQERVESHALPVEDKAPAIEFRNVSFTYEGAGQAQFVDLSLQIEPRTLVGIAGPSGAGKTTLVDLMLGLLDAGAGDIVIQGRRLKELSGKELRKIFAYVPQSIYLIDGTIAENIAFGISPDRIDWDRLNEIVKLCHLEGFVAERPDGLHSPIGEGGAKLSGGQRQRIGIARALYEEPSILILDESTSSLDGISEQAIVATLMKLKQEIAVITIAHRKSLIQCCDRIVLLNQGKVVGDGDFRTLKAASPLFSALMSEMERESN